VTSRTWTIREVLEWATEDFAARGIESPRLDAELLVAKALGIDRVGLYLDLNRPLVDRERSAIRPLVARRREREPVAYILGHRDFYGRRFSVTPEVNAASTVLIVITVALTTIALWMQGRMGKE